MVRVCRGVSGDGGGGGRRGGAGDESGVISRGENKGLLCYAKKHKNLAELWKEYKLRRERVRFGKIILTVPENSSR